MAWGGPPAGSPFGGQSATASSAAAGLPFAGVPSELVDRVEDILATEPDHPAPDIQFTQVEHDEAPFTLRRFLDTRRAALLGAFGLVGIETLATQAGPLLTQHRRSTKASWRLRRQCSSQRRSSTPSPS